MKHALDPLIADEIALAAKVTRENSGLDDTAWFETITLDEPRQTILRTPLPANRCAYVCCYERSSNRTLRGVVDLTAEALLQWDHIEGVQARIPPDEFSDSASFIKDDPGFQAACAERGIHDFDNVLVETWAAGNFGIPEEEGERIAYCHCWVSNDAGDNRYGRPIANLHPVVDLRRREGHSD